VLPLDVAIQTTQPGTPQDTGGGCLVCGVSFQLHDLPRPDLRAHPLSVSCCCCCCCCCCCLQMWTTVLPLDVAKTRIQTAQPGTPWDTGVLRQLSMLWREGGRRSLWAGLAPTVARAFPANACQVCEVAVL
jgi:hypothetical protein